MSTCRLKRAVLTEELFALTQDTLSSVILRQFLYWLPRRHDIDKFIAEELHKKEGKKDVELTGGWIYKTAKELKSEIMASQSEETIRRRIEDLIESGWLRKRRNPKYKWDRTYQYRPDLQKIESDLDDLGFTLATVMNEDYPLVACIFEDTSTIPQDVESKPQNGNSKTQDADALPETTTKKEGEARKGARRSLPHSPSLRDGLKSGAADSSTNSQKYHPSIQAVKEVSGYYPRKPLHDNVIELLGDEPDIEEMRKALKMWVAEGYNPMNLNGWLFDWYVNGAYYTKPTVRAVLDYESKDK